MRQDDEIVPFSLRQLKKMGDVITDNDKWCLLPEEKGSWGKPISVKETQSRKNRERRRVCGVVSMMEEERKYLERTQ